MAEHGARALPQLEGAPARTGTEHFAVTLRSQGRYRAAAPSELSRLRSVVFPPGGDNRRYAEL